MANQHASPTLAIQKYCHLRKTSVREDLPLMSKLIEPRLAPPGAGLPAVELFIGRQLFVFKRLFGSRESFAAMFEQERATIRHLVNACGESRRAERVLIRRLRGLEDSSRFWSVWMTLDHLRITNSVFAMVITSLARGKVPQRKASTADVKPDPNVTAAMERAYEDSCDQLIAKIAALPDLKETVRYAHPWFGPLDAYGWQVLSATHMAIHRAQIERIIAGLKK
ncbi:DinB family protein [Phragmitibacter flavus]|nr:DinB family protein [Phragmitibacter flavus]